MTFVSYAQNYEDVRLWRALRHIEQGRYLDIGAWDPIQDSVSKAFYDAGWRGVHVEPTPFYAQKLLEMRPDETVVQAAITDAAGPIAFYEFPDSGLSTGKSAIADRHAKFGFEKREILVPTVPLESLLPIAGPQIHWMKIDVEGMEHEVLRSWGECPLRPWLLVIESTAPLSQEPTTQIWAEEVLKRGYRETHFDGLSRYFIHEDHHDLAESFLSPPNLFDGFQVSSKHFSVAALKQRWESEAEQIRAEVAERDALISDSRRQLVAIQSEVDALASAKHAAEADAAEQLRRKEDAELRAAALNERLAAATAASQAAEAARVTALERLASAANHHAKAIDELWRERNEQEQSNRAEIDGLRTRLSEARLEMASIEQLLDRALAQRPGLWHRLGQVLGLAGDDPARRALDTWRAARSNFQCPGTESTIQRMNVSDGRNPYLRAESLADLLSWQDADFVRCAYVTMLGRQPDPVGEAYYTGRLRRGRSRMELLWQLRRSPEGRMHDPGIAGLDRALRRARWARIPVLGPFARLLGNGDTNGQFVPTQGSAGQRLLQGSQSAASNAGQWANEARPVKTVDDLLSFHDEEFVRQAYLYVLGRAVDPEGLNHFLARVRKGIDRRQILAELYWSAEGLKRKSRILGLEAAIRPFSWRRWIPSWFLRSRAAEERRHVRSMINDLYRLEARTSERLVQVETDHGQRLAHLERTLQGGIAEVRSFPPLGKSHRRRVDERVKASSLQRALNASEPRNTQPRLIYYFVDHTILCPVNTGMQRLVRQLGRCLIDEGEIVRFVKWDAASKSFVLISKAELDHLARWNGPVVPRGDKQLYKKGGGAAFPPSPDQDLWLLVPEVTHVTYQERPPTLDAVMAARALGAKVAFIYYDAIPLRLPEYEGGAAAHERYMQSLLLADALIPISRRSAAELQEFFVQYQRATTLPHIEALHLPGESMLAPRAQESRREATEKIILSVGSIEPRKNQLNLIAAFEEFSATPGGANWRLVLAGHLRADVAAQVNSAIERSDRISYVPHPSDAELDDLYRSAAFTVFPSVEEGFGLPILESLWFGVPCVCANFGAMAEVADGGGCLTINTRSVAEIRGALYRLATSPRLLADLSAQAVARPMTTWADYAKSVRSMLAQVGERTRHLQVVYFWVDDTCRNPHNSGIQRVVRQLARALIAQGYNLIPIRWADSRLSSVPDDELAHLERWNGPSKHEWGSWIDPEDSPLRSWLIIPELVHGHLTEVRTYAHSAGLRCAAIFYDAIPYKMKDVFGPVFARHHEEYMVELANFDKVLSISNQSHDDIKSILRERRVRTNSFDHRFEVVASLGSMVEHPRVHSVKNAVGTIKILSIISIEPRKNPLTLLEAFATAAKKSSREIKLTLVGRRIPRFDSIAAEVEAFEAATPNFEWLQDIDDDRLAGLYAEADFTVFPSLEEGYGLPIVESLWHGRPCIVHEEGATAEIGDGGGCVAVDMRDRDRLAGAILSLANDDAGRARLAKAAIERPVATWDDYARDIMRSISLDRLDDSIEPVTAAETRDIRQELVNLRKRPTLSVCISTYNRGSWLAVNLRSLFEQIPEPMAEIEFLVVDNASEDNTVEVVEPYLHRADFRFLRNPENVGMLGNLTVTAHEARGDYVWILGDDDLVKSGGILKVLEVINANPGLALIYPNYAYTQEQNPENVGDNIQQFLDNCPTLTPACGDVRATVKEIADKNENLFTAIYCLIFRRDHALRAYSQDTSGRPFSTMRTSIPTTYYVLNYMMDEPAYWIGSLLLVVNFNVSWNKYASLQILERVPEAQDLAERLGANSMDRWRENLLPGFVHYWREMFENDTHGNEGFFSPERVVMRMKHLDSFAAIVPQLAEIYDKAFASGHRAAKLPTAKLFSAFY